MIVIVIFLFSVISVSGITRPFWAGGDGGFLGGDPPAKDTLNMAEFGKVFTDCTSTPKTNKDYCCESDYDSDFKICPNTNEIKGENDLTFSEFISKRNKKLKENNNIIKNLQSSDRSTVRRTLSSNSQGFNTELNSLDEGKSGYKFRLLTLIRKSTLHYQSIEDDLVKAGAETKFKEREKAIENLKKKKKKQSELKTQMGMSLNQDLTIEQIDSQIQQTNQAITDLQGGDTLKLQEMVKKLEAARKSKESLTELETKLSNSRTSTGIDRIVQDPQTYSLLTPDDASSFQEVATQRETAIQGVEAKHTQLIAEDIEQQKREFEETKERYVEANEEFVTKYEDNPQIMAEGHDVDELTDPLENQLEKDLDNAELHSERIKEQSVLMNQVAQESLANVGTTPGAIGSAGVVGIPGSGVSSFLGSSAGTCAKGTGKTLMGKDIGPLAKPFEMIVQLLSSELAVFVMLFIFFFILMYAVFNAALKRTPIFKEGTQSKIAAVALAAIVDIAFFGISQRYGGPQALLTRFLNAFELFGGLILAITMFMIIYFGFRPEKGGTKWKLALGGAGMALLLVGSMICNPNWTANGMLILFFALIAWLFGTITDGMGNKSKSSKTGGNNDDSDNNSSSKSKGNGDGTTPKKSIFERDPEKDKRPSKIDDFTGDYDTEQKAIILNWTPNGDAQKHILQRKVLDGKLTGVPLLRWLKNKAFIANKIADLDGNASHYKDEEKILPNKTYIYQLIPINEHGRKPKHHARINVYTFNDGDIAIQGKVYEKGTNKKIKNNVEVFITYGDQKTSHATNKLGDNGDFFFQLKKDSIADNMYINCKAEGYKSSRRKIKIEPRSDTYEFMFEMEKIQQEDDSSTQAKENITLGDNQLEVEI